MASEKDRVRFEQIKKILDFCNHNKIRVTYGAVAGNLGVIPRMVGNYLGDRRVKASWIVRKDSKKPSGYPEELYHNELCKYSHVIDNIQELREALQKPTYKPPKTLFL